MRNKKPYTVGTVPKSYRKKYYYVRTVPKSNRKIVKKTPLNMFNMFYSLVHILIQLGFIHHSPTFILHTHSICSSFQSSSRVTWDFRPFRIPRTVICPIPSISSCVSFIIKQHL